MKTNHYGITVDSDVPVTGVHSVNGIAWEFIDDEVCLDCERAYEEFENGMHECEYGEGCNCADFIECDSSHTKLIGNWIKDDDGKYAPDKTGEFAAIVNESTIQVVWSKYTARHALCSPCYPGQTDNDSDGVYLGYCLPAYLTGEEEETEAD